MTDKLLKNIKIFLGCWGVFVASGIIICLVLVLLGMENNMSTVLTYYFTLGLPMVFIIFWPILLKHMK